jgi:2-amino-1-hydroxyethylphosphonate dioxygenase (glycine-forming)
MSSEVSKKIKNLIEKYGSNDYIGENISQKEHYLQCAMLAEKDNCEKEVIIGALLHDIGHLISIENNLEQIGVYGAKNHEKIGYDFAINYNLGKKIAHLIEYHVQTKRYLVTTDKNYYNNLSDASKKTLEKQGKMMNEKEIIEFNNNPYFKDDLKIREYDDKAKLEDIKLKSLDYYLNIIDTYIVNTPTNAL